MGARNRSRNAAAGQIRTGSHVIPYLVLAIAVVYFLMPVWWLVVASTKSNSGLFLSLIHI